MQSESTWAGGGQRRLGSRSVTVEQVAELGFVNLAGLGLVDLRPAQPSGAAQAGQQAEPGGAGTSRAEIRERHGASGEQQGGEVGWWRTILKSESLRSSCVFELRVANEVRKEAGSVIVGLREGHGEREYETRSLHGIPTVTTNSRTK